MRLLSPDDCCQGVKVPFGRRHAEYEGTTITVTDPVHIRALRAAGYTPADTGGAPARTAGFECSACGRRNYFRRCGKCGQDSEQAAAAPAAA